MLKISFRKPPSGAWCTHKALIKQGTSTELFDFTSIRMTRESWVSNILKIHTNLFRVSYLIFVEMRLIFKNKKQFEKLRQEAFVNWYVNMRLYLSQTCKINWSSNEVSQFQHCNSFFACWVHKWGRQQLYQFESQITSATV